MQTKMFNDIMTMLKQKDIPKDQQIKFLENITNHIASCNPDNLFCGSIGNGNEGNQMNTSKKFGVQGVGNTQSYRNRNLKDESSMMGRLSRNSFKGHIKREIIIYNY
jgi:hypothetical protein